MLIALVRIVARDLDGAVVDGVVEKVIIDAADLLGEERQLIVYIDTLHSPSTIGVGAPLGVTKETYPQW